MKPLIGLIMGSLSDWDTLSEAARVLEELKVPFEAKVVSAHRTPDLLFEYVESAEGRGIEVIIAGAGGAAHLPGMAASKTSLPILGVPVESRILKGIDSLLSIVQMPAGIPVGTLAIGRAGAINAALLAVAIIGRTHAPYLQALKRYRSEQTKRVLEVGDPRTVKNSGHAHAYSRRKPKKRENFRNVSPGKKSGSSKGKGKKR